MNKMMRTLLLSKPVEWFCEQHLNARAESQREQGWPSRFDSVSPEELAKLDDVFVQLEDFRAKKRAELAAKTPPEFPEVVSSMVPLQQDAKSHL